MVLLLLCMLPILHYDFQFRIVVSAKWILPATLMRKRSVTNKYGQQIAITVLKSIF